MPVLIGRRIMVAGGTGNVGRQLVRALLGAGATVVVPSRGVAGLEALGEFLAPASPERFVPLTGDITDEGDVPRLLREAGPLDGGVASLGRFVAAPSALEASVTDLERALHDYVLAHFAAARALLPVIRERDGGYVMINGPLAFDALFPGAGLVSIATAAQAMLARVLMKEAADTRARINELVIYSSFGRGADDENLVTGADIGRYVAHLLSARGAGVRGETIHVRSPEEVARQFGFDARRAP